jgi:hypothetical protein
MISHYYSKYYSDQPLSDSSFKSSYNYKNIKNKIIELKKLYFNLIFFFIFSYFKNKIYKTAYTPFTPVKDD